MSEPVSYTPAKYFAPSGQEIDPWDVEEALRAELPVLDQQDKLDYLLYRATNFTVYESLQLINTDIKVLKIWRSDDPVFYSWERERLPQLQSRIGPMLLYLQFTRIMRLSMKVDMDLVSRAAFKGMDALTKREYDVLRESLKRYGAGELTNFIKALKPETAAEAQVPSVQINVGDSAIDSVVQAQAMAEEVLKRFTQRDIVIEPEDYTVGNPTTDQS